MFFAIDFGISVRMICLWTRNQNTTKKIMNLAPCFRRDVLLYLRRPLAHVGALLVPRWSIWATFWTVVVRFWHLIESILILFVHLLLSTLSCRASARTTSRHPRRRNCPFQGHVRNLAEGIRTDGRVIIYCHSCNCLHWIQIVVHSQVMRGTSP